MKRKNLYAVFMIVIMVVISGCGKSGSSGDKEVSVETENIETASKETIEFENFSAEDKDIDSMIVEKDDSELDLKEYYYSLEDRTVCNDGENIFGSVIYNGTDLTGYVTTSRVPIYAENGVKMGYVKEGVDIIILGEYGGWCQFDLDGENRYARISDIEANSITIEERDAMAEEANKQEQASMKMETPAENVLSEESVQDAPVTNEFAEKPANDKYTPDEAIAVYRSLMEAGGITWNPGLKDVTSWGTGWIGLDKGYAEWVAETNLESFSIGNLGGDSWTEYYLEVTGSDENSVYFTEWHD